MKTNHNAEFGTVFFGAKIQMPDDNFEYRQKSVI